MPSEQENRDYFDFGAEPSPPETEPVERPEGEDDPELLDPVLEALRTVRDPEIPVNLVDLGLIYELVVKKGGIVFVEMTLTTPACPVAQSMPGEGRDPPLSPSCLWQVDPGLRRDAELSSVELRTTARLAGLVRLSMSCG